MSVTFVVLVFFFGKDVAWCVIVCVTYIFAVNFGPHNTHHLQVRVSGYFYFNDLTLL